MLQNIRKACTATALAGCIAFTPLTPQVQGQEPFYETATPIKHVVVLFQENVSFDHYFATYPYAANLPGEPQFRAGITPSVNGLSPALLWDNPNSTQPFRLDRSQNYTCDQDHDYTPEQAAFDGGLMDKFPENTGTGGPGCLDYGKGTGLTMGYYDGNTVTALWNYATHFSLNDNSYGTTFGPSTPGALNLTAGSTAYVDSAHTKGDLSDSVTGSTVIGDPDPFYDDCSGSTQVAVTGKNIGDLLNAANITWGWFEGGFAPTSTNNGTAVCGASTPNISGAVNKDYSPHHEPFQYFAQTANPHHLPPSSIAAIGFTDQANHQYDLKDFWHAVETHNMPAVSFIKAKKSQDGHAGYSSPLDEQAWLTYVLNRLQVTPEWASTAVVILWDDSDGWYDHVMGPIVNQSASPADALNNGACGSGDKALGGIQGRCGYGPRLPLLVISPWARNNFVDHTVTDQTSVIRFIEDNWLGGQRVSSSSFDNLAGTIEHMFNFNRTKLAAPVFLDPVTGEVTINK